MCFGRFESLPEISETFLGLPKDKVVHFAMFFPFPFLAQASFGRINRKPWHSLLFAVTVFLTGILLAAGTEIIQGMTEYRSAEPGDFRADALALAIGSVLALIIDIKQHIK